MKKCLITILLFFVLPVYAESISVLPDTIKQLIQNTQNVSVQFTQTKKIADMDLTLTSQGNIQFQKDIGIKYHLKTPSEMIFVSTPTHYCTKDTNGSLDDLPRFKEIKKMTDDFLNGDIQSLSKTFDLDYTDSMPWQLQATPKIREMKKFIRSIQLTGDTKQLFEIVIQYTNDDEITLKFSVDQKGILDEIKCPI